MADNTHETKIVISGDATIAVSSLKLVQAQVGKLIGYVKNAFSILGKINWVLGGIQTVYQWFGKFGCHKAGSVTVLQFVGLRNWVIVGLNHPITQSPNHPITPLR